MKHKGTLFTCTEDRLPWSCKIMKPHTHADDDAQTILCDCGHGHCWDIYKGCLPESHKTDGSHCDNCHGDCRCFDPEG